VRHCSNELNGVSWIRLYAKGEFKCEWVVDYMLWVQYASGVYTAQRVIDVLSRNGLLPEVELYLRTLATTGDLSDREWATQVLRLAGLTARANQSSETSSVRANKPTIAMLIDGFDDGLTMIQLIDIVYDSLSISKYDELRIIYELFSRAFNL